MTRAPDDRLETHRIKESPQHHLSTHTHTHNTSPRFLFKTSDFILLVNFLKLLKRRWYSVCAVYKSYTANHQQVYFPPSVHPLAAFFNNVVVMYSAWWRWGTYARAHTNTQTHTRTDTYTKQKHVQQQKYVCAERHLFRLKKTCFDPCVALCLIIDESFWLIASSQSLKWCLQTHVAVTKKLRK